MRPRLRTLSEQDLREMAATEIAAAMALLSDALASLVHHTAVGLTITHLGEAQTKAANAYAYAGQLREVRAQARRTGS